MKRAILLCLFVIVAIGISAQEKSSGQGAAIHDYIGIYQKYFSGLKRVHCPMYPTCSHYGMMAFADHSFPVAMVLTADRITRCGGHLEQYAEIAAGPHTGRRLDYPPGRTVPSGLITEPPHVVAAETIVPRDSVTKSIQFTNMLINQHSYASALLEIERLLYVDTAYIHEPKLYVNKLRCLEGLQQYSEGLLYYQQRIPIDVKKDYKIRYTAAHLYDIVGDYEQSVNLYRESALVWDSSEINPYGELAILYARKSMFDEAKWALEQKCSIDGNLAAYNESLDILWRLESAKPKNPTVAMLLGVLPGAGYLYTGQPRNALTSILANGLLAYACYTSIKSENYGLGIIVGIFSVSFYGGNIIGSGSSARRYNENQKRDAIAKLRNTNPFFY